MRAKRTFELIKIIIGKKVLQEGKIEIKIRRTGGIFKVKPEAVVDKIRELISSCK